MSARWHGIGRNRRGVALLAALWLVVMITTAGLQFATVARERRQLGIISSDQSRDRAALDGALSQAQARLEWEDTERLRADARRTPTRRTSLASDPWQDLSQRFVNPLLMGERTVSVQVVDLGTVLNLNLASETELASLIASVVGESSDAKALAQAIIDWRDQDTVARPLGAEADRYRRAGLPVQPANGLFHAVDDLLDVWGVTPPLFERLRPFLTVDGAVRRINLNAAPAVVLRTLPGMTEPLLTTILALRGRGRRVESIPALVSAAQNAGRAEPGEREALARVLSDAVSLDTRDVALELAIAEPRQLQPAQLVAVLHRNGDGTVDVVARRW